MRVRKNAYSDSRAYPRAAGQTQPQGWSFHCEECLFLLPAWKQDITRYRRRTRRPVLQVSFPWFCSFSYARIITNIPNVKGPQNLREKTLSSVHHERLQTQHAETHVCVFNEKSSESVRVSAYVHARKRKRGSSSPVCQDPHVTARFAPSSSSQTADLEHTHAHTKT
ncbi:hypothetical protein ILYODFUR_016620 [Ilyodon furcidens]|uniref:Uncharacterized protein n=1 Tax=Ilyodon furcidens TaxID=33524 RepID=A0ABV0TJ80_9TELE